MQCVMSLHQTLQGNERKAKSPARHREAYRSRLVRPGCEVMEDRILLSTALPDHHLTASALIGSAHPWFSVDPVSGTQIDLSWSRVAGATGYRVDELIGRTWERIAKLGSGSFSFAVTGLKHDTTYSFDVGYSRGATTTWAQYQSATTLGHSTTTPGGNWSGYAAETNLSQPQPNSVTKVSGSWIVPTVTGPSTGKTYSCVWVGIDGNNKSSGTVEQLGTEEDVNNGHPDYYAWWEMFPAQPYTISSMKVEPGDSITASVQYITWGAHAGQFHLSIVDKTSNHSFSKYARSSQYQSPLAAQRSSAEWIVEAPGVPTLPLADFGSVTFTNASAVINGVSGPINDSNWQHERMLICHTVALLDKTSVLVDLGTSFVVAYNSSAANAVSAGPALQAST